MSSPRSTSEEAEDHVPDYYVDATEEDTEDPDYDEDDEDDEDGEDGEEIDYDDVAQDLFEADDDEFHDAEEGNVSLLVQIEDDDNESGDDEDGLELTNVTQVAGLPQRQRILVRYYQGPRRSERTRELDPDRFPKVPSEKGRELMNSGTFGANDMPSSITTKKRLARRILDRELGIGNRTDHRINQGLMAQSMIPSSETDMAIKFEEGVYSGQFSDDGNFYFACVKDMKVRMYDTSNPYNWRHYKTVPFTFGSWTLTDASLSPDNKWLAYTSIQSNVCLAPTDPNDTGDPYMLSLSEHGGRPGWRGGFAIFSIRFSGDGRELVAGTSSNSIVVYDIESRQVLHTIMGHVDDVNAVCFADKSSPHILYSGSDDATIKVWDRRSMGDGREAGAFVGHIHGLTYIDSKNDGRYLLSNGKDQSMKLWDLKMMYTTARFHELNPRRHLRNQNDDYRWSAWDDRDWFPHPNDNSLVTFRGHKVSRTLIRCHFSPPGSTNSRYVYSGSHNGRVYIYNMDATIAAVVNVEEPTTKNHPELPWRHGFHDDHGYAGLSTVVRDASWHPTAPFIATSSLVSRGDAQGMITLHSYNESSFDEGEPEMGADYDEQLRPWS